MKKEIEKFLYSIARRMGDKEEQDIEEEIFGIRSYTVTDKEIEWLYGQAFENGKSEEMNKIKSKDKINMKTNKTIEEIVKEIIKILEDEIAIAHTSLAGQTSRLTSAYNRIKSLSQEDN